MSATIKEVFMDWLDINEFHNARIDTKSKSYTNSLECYEEFYVTAKTNADDGDEVNIQLNLLDKDKSLLKKIDLESHVENQQVKETFILSQLAEENSISINKITEINATIQYKDDKYLTNKAKVCRALKSKELKDSATLNDIVEDKEKKVFKKTTPTTKGDEVKLIQQALQKMKIDIGNDGVDGKFGNDADNAIKMFQENYKPTHKTHEYTWSKPDGVVGKNTILAMDEALVEGWKYEVKDELITKKMLQKVCSNYNPTSEFMIYLNKYAKEFQVNTVLRISHFLSQLAHESQCFSKTKESLYYTKNNFLSLYKNTRTPNGVDFDNYETYKHLLKNSDSFANWRYGYTNKENVKVNHRGRGYIHITWKTNYESYTEYYQKKHNDITKDFVETPDLLEQLPYSLEASFHFWYKNNINSLADRGSLNSHIKKVTKKVNGGYNGLTDRETKFSKIHTYMKEK
jgi:type VI secretion system secreted protein VgrG